MNSDQKPILRCAIYTRKSSDEGLEQSFNSLDAQREACEAFIVSQRQEGWRALPTRYDDGGYSGGSMERPALKRLLEDVQASKLNIIIVYKVDRLTRSLADFAKIVEALDARGVSFVSVTQQFNGTICRKGFRVRLPRAGHHRIHSGWTSARRPQLREVMPEGSVELGRATRSVWVPTRIETACE